MLKTMINLKIITPSFSFDKISSQKILLLEKYGFFELLNSNKNFINISQLGILYVRQHNIYIACFILSQSFIKFNKKANNCTINSLYALNNLNNIKREAIIKKIKQSKNVNEQYFYQYALNVLFVNKI